MSLVQSQVCSAPSSIASAQDTAFNSAAGVIPIAYFFAPPLPTGSARSSGLTANSTICPSAPFFTDKRVSCPWLCRICVASSSQVFTGTPATLNTSSPGARPAFCAGQPGWTSPILGASSGTVTPKLRKVRLKTTNAARKLKNGPAKTMRNRRPTDL